jgi:hypothetical protein
MSVKLWIYIVPCICKVLSLRFLDQEVELGQNSIHGTRIISEVIQEKC